MSQHANTRTGTGETAPPRARRAARALAAAAVAIAVNTGLLWLMDGLGLRTAHGGLLRLLQMAGGGVAGRIGLGRWWRGVLVPATTGASLQLGFHVAVGLLMGLAYAAVAPALRGGALARGLLCAAAIWFLNAGVVLPLIGEGFAGMRNLTIAGVAGFAAAHTAFFVLLALLYGRPAGRASAP